MNEINNIYLVLYAKDPNNKANMKIVQVFTDPRKLKIFMLAEIKNEGEKQLRDHKWQVQVYSFIASEETYEFSKTETSKIKSLIGICGHCHYYFERINNSNFCADCLNEVKNGKKDCEVCHSFFFQDGSCFVSNGKIYPSLACQNCSKFIINQLVRV